MIDYTFAKGGYKNIYDTKIYLYKTSNKMKCLMIPLHNSNTITIGFMIPSGSRNEKDAFGISHFLEHMIFKGTEKKSSEYIMNKLDSIGAMYNAMTGYEYTIYYISGDPNDIEIILDIILELYFFPLFPEKDISNERNVVLEEFKMNEDNNHRVLTNKMNYILYNNIDPGLARPIIGYKETIEKLSRDDIINYRNKYYKINKLLLCISGSFNKNDIKNMLKNKMNLKFKKIKNKFKFNDKFNYKNILDLNKNIDKYIHIEKDINQTIIYFYFNIIDKNNNNLLIIDMICNILSNGFSSRLFNLLRNKMGVSYYNNSFTRTYNKYGNLIINVGVDNTSVINTVKEIINELNDIKNNGIILDELNKSKKQINTNILFQFKNPYEYFMYYGLNYIDKQPMLSISDMIDRVNNVKLDDMNHIIKKIFNNSNILIGTIGKLNNDIQSEIKKLVDNAFN